MTQNPYRQLAGAVGALELDVEELEQLALPLYDAVVSNHLANIRELVVSLRATCQRRATALEGVFTGGSRNDVFD